MFFWRISDIPKNHKSFSNAAIFSLSLKSQTKTFLPSFSVAIQWKIFRSESLTFCLSQNISYLLDRFVMFEKIVNVLSSYSAWDKWKETHWQHTRTDEHTCKIIVIEDKMFSTTDPEFGCACSVKTFFRDIHTTNNKIMSMYKRTGRFTKVWKEKNKTKQQQENISQE